jgi:hypothetical protein
MWARWQSSWLAACPAPRVLDLIDLLMANRVMFIFVGQTVDRLGYVTYGLTEQHRKSVTCLWSSFFPL